MPQVFGCGHASQTVSTPVLGNYERLGECPLTTAGQLSNNFALPGTQVDGKVTGLEFGRHECHHRAWWT